MPLDLGCAAAHDRGVPNRERILQVEDDRASQTGLFLLLREEGFSVLTADNGQQALDLLQHGIRPRLMILDLMLPKVSGYDVLKDIMSDPSLRDMRVIVVTALAPEEAAVMGADAVLFKPIDHKRLIRTVRALMGHPSAV